MLNRWILWINKRNNTYIKEFNPQKGIRLANNKNQTKKFLIQRGIPVPQTLFHFKSRQSWLSFNFNDFHNPTFVIKPNKGSKWTWIFVIKEWRKSSINNNKDNKKNSNLSKIINWINVLFQREEKILDSWYEFLIWNTWITEQELKKEVVGIFDGKYSSTNRADTIILEDRLIPWPWFEEFCEYGLADMRVILFNLVPIIAMLRMPTKESWGKANLAQWGIGLWLDIVTGKITSLYRRWQSYTNEFPSEWKHFKNKKIPYWQEIIQYSANAQYFVNIWYLWMDRVITKKWPKLLEINARAGLEIQNITGKPLLSIMKKIEDIDVTTPNKWIEISKSLFSDEHISEFKEQHIVYLSQTGKLLYQKENKKRGLPITITVGIDKLKNYTSDRVMRKLIGAKDISIDLWHHDTIFKNISLTVSKEVQGNKIILWQQSLANYYIKPIHKSKVSTRILNPECIVEDEIVSLKLLDEKINTINKQLNLAQILRPSNYLDEFDKFVSLHGEYNPQFVYQFPTYKELHQLTEQIKELDIKYRQKEYFDSSFANLFFEKLNEMDIKISLIKAYKKQDFKLIDFYNKKLFGTIDSWLLKISKQKIQEWNSFTPSQLWPILKWKDMIQYIKDYINIKKLEWVRVRIDDSTLSRISVWFWKFATIKVKSTASFREYKLISKLVHEIDVHVMRYLNGKKTWWNLFSTGTAKYLEIEEWISVYLANQKLREYIPSYDGIAKYKNYYFVEQSSTLNFAELWKHIIDTKSTVRWRSIKNINYKILFNTVLKYKKWQKDTSIKNTGIIFWKNLVYLNGYEKIKKIFTTHPEEVKQLLKYGKCKVEDLKYMKS